MEHLDLVQQVFKLEIMTITCSAPGSITFMGEYAALFGYPTVMAAITQRFTVSITPIDEPVLDVYSDVFGDCIIDLASLSAPPSYQYTLASFKQFLPALQDQGFRIYFHPDVEVDRQLGMLAAITVALCSAFYHHVHGHLNLEDICRIACQAVSSVQAHSSCADVIASTYGGIIRYATKTEEQPASVRRVWSDIPIFAVYSGHITSESIVMHRGLMRAKENPEVYRKIHADIGTLSELFFAEVQNGNTEELGVMLKCGDRFLRAYESHTKATEEIMSCLANSKTVYGAKISGAGLGGCVVGLGKVDTSKVAPYELIRLSVDDVGVRLDPRVGLRTTKTAYNML